MMTEEAERDRAYHEVRCKQELRRISEARCDRSKHAHIRLFQLHYSMTANPAAGRPTATLAMVSASG
jgi:hypothetical protein